MNIGEIVHYALTEEDATFINGGRADWNSFRTGSHEPTGCVRHMGNYVMAGETYPAMIVAIWGVTAESPVNLQVHLDGTDTHWATSVTAGDGPGHWHYPAGPELAQSTADQQSDPESASA